MKKAGADHGLISSQELSLVDVPSPDADREILEAFCLTIDGYEGGRNSPDDLFEEAQRIERAGLENATLDELRVAAFIRQRELRWGSYGDDAADAPLVRKIRDLVEEIRRRVGEE